MMAIKMMVFIFVVVEIFLNLIQSWSDDFKWKHLPYLYSISQIWKLSITIPQLNTKINDGNWMCYEEKLIRK